MMKERQENRKRRRGFCPAHTGPAEHSDMAEVQRKESICTTCFALFSSVLDLLACKLLSTVIHLNKFSDLLDPQSMVAL